MKKLSIIKQGQVVQSALFDNDQAIEDFKAVLAKGEAWGLPERPELDEMGKPTGVMLPAEYTVEIEDLTEKIKAEKLAKEAKEKAKADRKAARKAVDWSKNLSTKQLQDIVKNLVEEAE